MSESRVLHQQFYSPALGCEKRYCIYLPPGYERIPGQRYSSLYLLPGLMDYERTWIDKGRVHERMDALLQERRIVEYIVVMPDKDQAATEDEGELAFARYLGQDLIHHIDSSWRTLPSRSHRGIEGLSLGAGWAMRMLLFRPDLYCSVGCLSGGFDEESYAAVQRLRQPLLQSGTRFRVGVGLGEPESIENNQRFVSFLRSMGFYCELDMQDGPHDWPLWTRQVYNSLQFHSYSFNPR